MGRTIILCPLEIERAAAARAVRPTRRLDVEIHRTGPGPKAVARALDDVARTEPPDLIILAGLAGAAQDVAPCPRIRRVVDLEGNAWMAPMPPTGPGDAAVTLLGVDEPVTSAAEKRRLARATGAALIDTESHVFAERCSAAGLTWCVVRAVSDGPEAGLPPRCLRWIGEDGRTKHARALLDLLKHPSEIGAILALSRRTNAALAALERSLKAILTAAAPLAPPPPAYHADP